MSKPSLALCLLRAGCEGELTATSFKSDVRPLLASSASPAELRRAEHEAREALVSAGWANRPAGARSRLALTETGREEAARLLGLAGWPKKPANWGKLVRPALVARALQVRPADAGKLKSVDFIRREILRQFGGESVGVKKLSPTHRARAAAAIGAIRGDKVDLIFRLAQRAAAALKPAWAPESDIDEFASEVLRLAKGMKGGRLGRNLVFVNHAWKAFVEAHPDSGLDLDGFKQRLREAWAAEKMPLAVANVLEAQWHRDLAESRIDYGRHYWHVIDLAAA